MEISWSSVDSNKVYVVPIKIETEDKVGVMQLVLAKVTDSKTNIAFASGFSKQNKRGIIELGLEVRDIESLTKIMNSIQSLPEVVSVKRTHASQNMRRGRH